MSVDPTLYGIDITHLKFQWAIEIDLLPKEKLL